MWGAWNILSPVPFREHLISKKVSKKESYMENARLLIVSSSSDYIFEQSKFFEKAQPVKPLEKYTI